MLRNKYHQQMMRSSKVNKCDDDHLSTSILTMNSNHDHKKKKKKKSSSKQYQHKSLAAGKDMTLKSILLKGRHTKTPIRSQRPRLFTAGNHYSMYKAMSWLDEEEIEIDATSSAASSSSSNSSHHVVTWIDDQSNVTSPVTHTKLIPAIAPVGSYRKRYPHKRHTLPPHQYDSDDDTDNKFSLLTTTNTTKGDNDYDDTVVVSEEEEEEDYDGEIISHSHHSNFYDGDDEEEQDNEKHSAWWNMAGDWDP